MLKGLQAEIKSTNNFAEEKRSSLTKHLHILGMDARQIAFCQL